MHPQNRPITAAATLLASVFALAAMGPSCGDLLPPPDNRPMQLTVELVNATPFEVLPELYVDPEKRVYVGDQIVADDNFVDIGDPLAPGEIVELGFDCADAGSFYSDHALMLPPGLRSVPSDNAPLLRQGIEFRCGDTVSFIFIYATTPAPEFFTRIEVNGRFVMD